MLGVNVTPEHFSPSPALQAYHIVGSNGLADRNSRVLGGRFRRFPQRRQRLVNGVDESGHVGERDLVLLDIAADDLSDQ